MGIRVDPGPLDYEAARRWPEDLTRLTRRTELELPRQDVPAQEPHRDGQPRYGIEVIGTEPGPPKLELIRRYLRQALVQGLNAAGVPDGSQPTDQQLRLQALQKLGMPRGQQIDAAVKAGAPLEPYQAPPAPRGWSLETKPAAKPAPEMPASPRGQADHVQYALSSQPFGGVESKLLQDLGKHLGMDPLDVMRLGPDMLAKLSMEMGDMQAEGYSPYAIAYVLQAMIGQPEQQPNVNASLTRR